MKGEGKIIACELDKERVKRLECTIKQAGATSILLDYIYPVNPVYCCSVFTLCIVCMPAKHMHTHTHINVYSKWRWTKIFLAQVIHHIINTLFDYLFLAIFYSFIPSLEYYQWLNLDFRCGSSARGLFKVESSRPVILKGNSQLVYCSYFLFSYETWQSHLYRCSAVA